MEEVEIMERLGMEGSTGVVGTMVESAPLIELDR